MRRIVPLVLCSLLLLARPVLAGVIWNEAGSAGDLPATANNTVGAGSLDLILGNLLDFSEVDMYLISISDFASFSATTEDNGFSVNDPQLFLFDATGRAVYMNDDGDGLGSQSGLPAGDANGPSSNGLYYLAIGWFDNEPLSAPGLMFLQDVGTNGPDPVGGASPVIDWNRDAFGRPDLPTGYNIHLTGAEPANAAIPEPASTLLLLCGCAGLAARARRLRT